MMKTKIPDGKVLMIIFGSALILTLFTNGWLCCSIIDSWWGKFLDPIIGVGTFLLALYILRLEHKHEFLESLPKKLTVHFTYNGEYLMSCFEASLTGESDVRAWSQQIGLQMTEKSTLQFFPHFDRKNPTVKEGKYLLHEFTIQLTNFPANLPESHRNDYQIWVIMPNRPEFFKPTFVVGGRSNTPFTKEQAIAYILAQHGPVKESE